MAQMACGSAARRSERPVLFMLIHAVLVCVAGALLASLLGKNPALRMSVVIATGLCAVGLCVDGIREGVAALSRLSTQAGLTGAHASAMIRATGIAVLAEFGAQLCRDAGESALAGRVELAGRVALMGVALPVLAELTERLGALMA